MTRHMMRMQCGCMIVEHDSSGALRDLSIEHCSRHAAAPDLLAACKAACEAARLAGVHQHPDGDELPWYTLARAAIAKAEQPRTQVTFRVK